jgi:hypothetical protein
LPGGQSPRLLILLHGSIKHPSGACDTGATEAETFTFPPTWFDMRYLLWAAAIENDA